MPRLFIAIDLPERIRDDITSTYMAIPGAKWIEDSQIHLTLRFIGEVDGETERRIDSALQSITSPPFSLSIKGVGHFPPRKEPRVLWVGVSDDQNLLKLQSKIERTLISIGLAPEDRKFHPHITIARLNGSPHEKVALFLSGHSLFETEPFDISEFSLYSSTLRKEGALHIKEVTYKLHE